MRKLVGLGVLAALTVAAPVVIPLVVPVGVYEGRLAALVNQATGRGLKIAGPVRLWLVPVPEFEASDVSLANMPGMHPAEMVKVRRLRMRLAVLPLLHGVVVVSRLDLVRPRIALEIDKAGHPDWVFGPAAVPAFTPAGGTAAPAAAGGGPGISGLLVRQVRLTDGEINYIDRRTGRAEQLDDINMTLSQPSLGRGFTGDGSAVWNGGKLMLAVSVDQPRALLDGGESQVGIKLAVAALKLDFSGRVAGLPSAKLDGVIDLETPSARQLAQWAGAPIAWGGNGLGPLALTGTVAVAGTKISLSDADLSLDAITAKGSASIDNAGARPMITGKLDVDKLDLNPYLAPQTGSAAPPVAARGPPPARSSVAQTGGSAMPAGVSPFALADVDLDLKVGGILYRDFQTGATAVVLRVKDGRLSADLARMALYQGHGHGTVTVDGNGAAPRVGLNFALAQVQIAPLVQAAIGNHRLSGTGSLDIAVTGRGPSQRDFIGTLDGSGALSLANGRIDGVDLPALAQSAAKIERDFLRTLNVSDTLNLLARGQINRIAPLALVENAAKSFVGGTNTTNFATLSASCTVAGGLLRNNDLRLKLGMVPMTGAGTVDLRTRAVDYRVSLQLGQGVVVPIQVDGTWDNLSYRPDLGAMLTQTPGNVLTILKSAGGNVGQGLQGVGQGAVGVLNGIGQGAIGGIKGIFGK
jgi:AsmA protein